MKVRLLGGGRYDGAGADGGGRMRFRILGSVAAGELGEGTGAEPEVGWGPLFLNSSSSWPCCVGCYS